MSNDTTDPEELTREAERLERLLAGDGLSIDALTADGGATLRSLGVNVMDSVADHIACMGIATVEHLKRGEVSLSRMAVPEGVIVDPYWHRVVNLRFDATAQIIRNLHAEPGRVGEVVAVMPADRVEQLESFRNEIKRPLVAEPSAAPLPAGDWYHVRLDAVTGERLSGPCVAFQPENEDGEAPWPLAVGVDTLRRLIAEAEALAVGVVR